MAPPTTARVSRPAPLLRQTSGSRWVVAHNPESGSRTRLPNSSSAASLDACAYQKQNGLEVRPPAFGRGEAVPRTAIPGLAWPRRHPGPTANSARRPVPEVAGHELPVDEARSSRPAHGRSAQFHKEGDDAQIISFCLAISAASGGWIRLPTRPPRLQVSALGERASLAHPPRSRIPSTSRVPLGSC